MSVFSHLFLRLTLRLMLRVRNYKKEDFHMADKAKKIIRFIATGVIVTGVVGLFVSGGSEADISNAVKIGTMIASIISSVVLNVVKK